MGGLGRGVAPRGMRPSSRSPSAAEGVACVGGAGEQLVHFWFFALDSSAVCINPGGVQRTRRPSCNVILKPVLSIAPLTSGRWLGFQLIQPSAR